MRLGRQRGRWRRHLWRPDRHGGWERRRRRRRRRPRWRRWRRRGAWRRLRHQAVGRLADGLVAYRSRRVVIYRARVHAAVHRRRRRRWRRHGIDAAGLRSALGALPVRAHVHSRGGVVVARTRVDAAVHDRRRRAICLRKDEAEQRRHGRANQQCSQSVPPVKHRPCLESRATSPRFLPSTQHASIRPAPIPIRLPSSTRRASIAPPHAHLTHDRIRLAC